MQKIKLVVEVETDNSISQSVLALERAALASREFATFTSAQVVSAEGLKADGSLTILLLGESAVEEAKKFAIGVYNRERQRQASFEQAAKISRGEA